MLGFDDALRRVVESARFVGSVAVPLPECAGRVLAERVAADLDVPPFDTTAMDGWAVRALEAGAGASLVVAGALAAGSAPSGALAPGTALKVMTGAPIPGGCDAIVPVEESEILADARVRISTAPKAGAHIRRRGEVIAAGEALLAPGRRLTAADLAVAAAAGRDMLRVARRVRAGVLVTGDEVVPSGSLPGPAQIRNTNGPLLLGALRRLGCEVESLGTVADRETDLDAALGPALDGRFDLLLTTGGVSAGDWDLLPAVLARLGAEIVFHRIALRPAKPLLFARAGATLVFGLPGNPVSAGVAFDLFVRAAWRTASGLEPSSPGPVEASLDGPVRNRGARLAMHPAAFSMAGGRLRASPLATRGSHDLAAHARANGLLRLDPESAYEAGALVPAYLGTEETTLG